MIFKNIINLKTKSPTNERPKGAHTNPLLCFGRNFLSLLFCPPRLQSSTNGLHRNDLGPRRRKSKSNQNKIRNHLKVLEEEANLSACFHCFNRFNLDANMGNFLE